MENENMSAYSVYVFNLKINDLRYLKCLVNI